MKPPRCDCHGGEKTGIDLLTSDQKGTDKSSLWQKEKYVRCVAPICTPNRKNLLPQVRM